MTDHIDPPRPALPRDRAVVIIGAGTMGSGIAEVAACGGHPVYLRDTSEAALERGIIQIRGSLDKRVERGRLDTSQRDAIVARLRPVGAEARLDNVGLVIEVIVENLDVKVAVLRQLETEVEADTIIATNTSSLSVTAIAGRLARPELVVGMHFFNPATVLPLVEVVSGAATAPEVTQTVFETARAWGKVPVVCRSTPGLGEPLVLYDLALDYAACGRVALAAAAQASAEHLATAIGLFTLLGKKVSVLADVPGLAVTRTVAMPVNEAADAVHQGIASADDVDAAMQKGVNYPIGPLAWGRQVGFAHIATVLRHLAQAYGEDRYRTSLWLQHAVHAAQPLGAGHR